MADPVPENAVLPWAGLGARAKKRFMAWAGLMLLLLILYVCKRLFF